MQGRRIGPYELERELGQGGMGAVWLARHVERGERVALKTMTSLDPRMRRRFEEEARAMLRLRHPRIVAVHDLGGQGGVPWLALELVEGPSLAQRLKQEGPLPVVEAAGIVRDLAEALAFVHGEGLLHRDLKPGNVLVDAEGRVRLTDFGLARGVEGDEGERSRLTRTGECLGTPGYMPPEQIDMAKEADARADVYGLGATLFALLTGRAPFQGESVINTITAVLRDPPTPPRSLRPEVPARLEAIVLRCLAKEPDDRYPSAAALQAELEAWLAAPEGRGLGVWLAASAAVLLLAGGALAWVLTRPRAPDDVPAPLPSAPSSPPRPTGDTASVASSPPPTPDVSPADRARADALVKRASALVPRVEQLPVTRRAPLIAEATALLTKARALVPEHLEALRVEGRLLWDVDDDRSLACFSRLLERQPDDVPALLERAQHHLQRDHRLATQDALRAAKLGSGREAIDAGYVLFTLGRDDLLKQLTDRKPAPRAPALKEEWSALQTHAANLGRLRAAGAARFPIERVEAELPTAGNFPLAQLDAMIAHARKRGDMLFLRIGLRHRSIQHRGAKPPRFAKAIKDADALIQHFPELPDGYELRALAKRAAGQLAAAVEDMERALTRARKRQSPSVQRLSGYLAAWRFGNR